MIAILCGVPLVLRHLLCFARRKHTWHVAGRDAVAFAERTVPHPCGRHAKRASAAETDAGVRDLDKAVGGSAITSRIPWAPPSASTTQS